MAAFTKVEGAERGDVKLYALSTCIWCRKTRQLLDALKISYSYLYVDLLPIAEQDAVMAEMASYNPRRSFPTIVVDGVQVVSGFEEARIKEILR
jgi:glutaredoxin-like protein NrdH